MIILFFSICPSPNVKGFPEDGKYKAILQITHGMIEYIERYHEFAEYLTERGFMVVGHDHLGPVSYTHLDVYKRQHF